MIMFLISYTACLELLDTKAIKNIIFHIFGTEETEGHFLFLE